MFKFYLVTQSLYQTNYIMPLSLCTCLTLKFSACSPSEASLLCAALRIRAAAKAVHPSTNVWAAAWTLVSAVLFLHTSLSTTATVHMHTCAHQQNILRLHGHWAQLPPILIPTVMGRGGGGPQ
jgi:hypothetical protein